MIESLIDRIYYPENINDKYYIPGFDVSKEVDSLSRHRNVIQVETNIRSYIREYAKQGLVLPNLIDLSEDGKLTNLTGIPITPGITDEERNGSVLEASLKAERFLREALPGSTVVIASPKGPSGMRDQLGVMINYPMTQTLVYWKEDDGHLRGVTLVSDLDKHQNRQLLIKLGVAPDNLISSTGGDEMEDLARIVRNPALLRPNSGLSVANVVGEVLNIRGFSDIRFDLPDGGVEFRSVNEYRRDLARFDNLLIYNSDAEKYIEDFRNFMLMNVDNLDDVFTQRRLEAELFKTILKITGTLEEFKVSGMNLDLPAGPLRREASKAGILRGVYTERTCTERSRSSRSAQDDSYGYGKEMAFLQTKVGCNGSGSSGVRILMGGSSYNGIFKPENSLSGKCSKCGINHAVLGGCGFCESCGRAV